MSSVVLGPRHGDVEQPPFLLDLVAAAGAEVGGDAAVDAVEQEHRLPFLPLGRMDGGEDQVVLVEQRRSRLVAGGVRRVEGELGQEALAARIAGGDLLELEKVVAPDDRVLVDALQMRLVPQPHPLHLRRPSRAPAAQVAGKRREVRPVGRRPRRRPPGRERRAGLRPLRQPVEHLRRVRRADAGEKLQHAEARHPVARVLGEAQQRQHVLHVRRIEELEPAVLDERDVAPGQLDLELAAVMGGAEEHRLLLQRHACLAVGEHPLDHVARLVGLVGDHHQRRLVAGLALRPQLLGVALLGKRDHRVGGGEDRLGRAVVALQASRSPPAG